LRRSQARERTALQNDISKAQKEITVLQEQRAPVAAENRKIEAEVGPIKYIAALVYGDNPEANTLEKAVRWVIILIVIVFDPLALTLLLAATKTFEWERSINILAPGRKKSTYEPDDGPLTDDQIDQIKDLASKDLPRGNTITKDKLFPDYNESVFDREEIPLDKPINLEENKKSVLDVLGSMWNRSNSFFKKDVEAEHAPLATPQIDSEIEDDLIDENLTHAEKEAQRAWKEANPQDTIKHHRLLYKHGLINTLPWHNPEYQDQLGLIADNLLVAATGEMRGFGTSFPSVVNKGDMFLRVDQLPSVLYKFNGVNWIEVDKELSDQHAYNDEYIDHLIEKISTGEYDPELLSNAERDSIEKRLNNNPRQA
jgi:hypothetical protein